jgi:hypothetical protein
MCGINYVGNWIALAGLMRPIMRLSDFVSTELSTELA